MHISSMLGRPEFFPFRQPHDRARAALPDLHPRRTGAPVTAATTERSRSTADPAPRGPRSRRARASARPSCRRQRGDGLRRAVAVHRRLGRGLRRRPARALARARLGGALRRPHAVAMNSATSALNAAAAAAGVGPGDEVIVSPYTMSASAVCALVHGAIPVFADIEPGHVLPGPGVRARAHHAAHEGDRRRRHLRLPGRLRRAHGDRPRARPGRHRGRRAGARRDARGGRSAGTLGHIGVFSLNYHKTIQCGEGGVAVTDDDALAERLALARNHGEAVVGDMGSSATDVLGFNYRMGELEAAIAEAQLARLDELTEPRIAHAERLTEGLADLEGITPPLVPAGARHVYYLHVVRLDEEALGVPRAAFAAALLAEGVPVTEGYVAPLYRQPLYRERAAARVRRPAQRRLGQLRGRALPDVRAHARPRGAVPPARARGPERGRRRRHRGRVPQGARAPRELRAEAARRSPRRGRRRADRGLAAARARRQSCRLDGPARAVFARRLPDRTPLDARPGARWLRPRPVRLQRRRRPRAPRRARGARGAGAQRRLARPLGQLPGALRPSCPTSCGSPTSTRRGSRARPSRAAGASCSGNPYLEDAAAEIRALEGPRGAGERVLYVTEPTSVAAARAYRRPARLGLRGARGAARLPRALARAPPRRCACDATQPSRRRSTRAAGRVRPRARAPGDARRGHRVGGHRRRLRHDGDGGRPRRGPARHLGHPAGGPAALAAVRRDRAAIRRRAGLRSAAGRRSGRPRASR